MAFLDTVRPMVYGHHVGSRLHRVASQLIDSVVAWNRTRITRNELSRLSDRELADIGVSRDEVERIGR